MYALIYMYMFNFMSDHGQDGNDYVRGDVDVDDGADDYNNNVIMTITTVMVMMMIVMMMMMTIMVNRMKRALTPMTIHRPAATKRQRKAPKRIRNLGPKKKRKTRKKG